MVIVDGYHVAPSPMAQLALGCDAFCCICEEPLYADKEDWLTLDAYRPDASTIRLDVCRKCVDEHDEGAKKLWAQLKGEDTDGANLVRCDERGAW